MDRTLSLIGFGEAGSNFALAAGWEDWCQVFDIAEKQAECAAIGVTCCASLAVALSGSSAIFSLVTADAALAVAEDAAKRISAGALFFDMNSVAPDTKRVAAQAIEAAGGRYVDVAIMAPVNPARLNVPLLLAGQHTAEGEAVLASLGFANFRSVGDEVGRASSIKMIRSVLIKGQEALIAEMMLAAERAGVTGEVLLSLGQDWPEKAAYNLERMHTHGLRRAAEMEQVAMTLAALGVAPLMTKGTIQWQREMAQMEVGA